MKHTGQIEALSFETCPVGKIKPWGLSQNDLPMGIHVVIISPSRDNLQLLSDKLSAGYHWHTATDFTRLLNICNKYPIHIILCAEGASTRGIFNLCRRIKNHNQLAHLPVILITGKERMFDRIRSLEAGADIHIGGSVFREHLDLEIKNLVANRGRMRRHLVGGVQQQKKRSVAEHRELLLKLNECRSVLFRNEKAGVKQLASLMHMSRPTLYRKLKVVTDLTPNEWINEARMQRAAELLAEGRYRAFQVARLLGYTSQSSFGKMFRKQYKVTPAAYQRMGIEPKQFQHPLPASTPAQ